MNDQPFEIFGGVHIFSLLIIVLMTVWLSLFYKDRTDDQKSGMAKILAYILIAHILSSPIKDLFILENPYSWK
ncbi:MAG: TIGR02206 family membrane protein, partial [Gammaproteobacteria bacterium]